MQLNGTKIHIYRTFDEIDVLLLPHKDGSGWSFINVAKGHICPCKFESYKLAIEDLNDPKKNIIRWEIVEEMSI